jgi:8-oxo-dGTP pyrophosphatase MutT (NUDIX family)
MTRPVGPSREPVERPSARAVVTTPDWEVLLIHHRDPASGRELWVTPGGGIEPGEDARGAIRRELQEETGLVHPLDGPMVWTRRASFPWNATTVISVESYFWCPAARFDAHPADLADDDERASYLGTRWWTIDELDAPHGQWLAPSRMGALVRSLRDSGPPDPPVDAGS